MGKLPDDKVQTKSTFRRTAYRFRATGFNMPKKTASGEKWCNSVKRLHEI